jgi:hypothetical protein
VEWLYFRWIYVQQGVKQGGLLSADLYKLYIEDLLQTFQEMDIGAHIGDITVNAIACADEV